MKYPVKDVSLQTKNGSEINVDKDDTSLPLPKPSSNTKITRKRDRVLKRKRKKGTSNAYKFGQSLSTFNSFEVTSTDSDDDSSLPKSTSTNERSATKARYLSSLRKESIAKPPLNWGLPQQVQGTKILSHHPWSAVGHFISQTMKIFITQASSALQKHLQRYYIPQ